MAIRVKTIQNISNQTIEVLHESGDADNAAGDINYTSTGMLRIGPGASVTVEEARLDLGQLENLSAKNLIKVSSSLI